MTIDHASPLGTIVATWSEFGLRRLSFVTDVLGPSEDSDRREPSRAVATLGKPLSERILREQADRLRDCLTQFFEGTRVSFSSLIVDESHFTPLTRQIYAECRSIPHGKTCTYGDLARRVNRPAASRAVGGAMARNPVPLVIPCHRVLASSGKLCGFSAPGGLETKRRLLELERTGCWSEPSLLWENVPARS